MAAGAPSCADHTPRGPSRSATHRAAAKAPPPRRPPPSRPAARPVADPVFQRIAQHLPKGWRLRVEADRLIIEREKRVWMMFENKINMPVSKETVAEREAKIRCLGRLVTSQIRFRLEPRWTPRHRRQVEATNRSVRAAIRALQRKHHVATLIARHIPSMDRDYPGGLTPTERRRFTAYLAERRVLDKRVLPVPVFETARHALFSLPYVGWDDSFHSVAPASAARECYAVDRQVRAILGGARRTP